jgi:hypothetical protein
MVCWHETDSDLSLSVLVRDRLRPGDRVTGSPYVTFLAKRLPAGEALTLQIREKAGRRSRANKGSSAVGDQETVRSGRSRNRPQWAIKKPSAVDDQEKGEDSLPSTFNI